MVAAALRRRVMWGSREEMVASYGSRPPLDRLDPEALRAYVRWGTVPSGNGCVELACPPEVEAAIFGAPPVLEGVVAAWDHLARLTAPATILAGKDGLPTEWFEEQAARAGAPLEVVDGGHFFLHEDSDRGAALIDRHVGRSHPPAKLRS